MPLRAKRPTAISMRRRTAMSIRTPGVVGSKPRVRSPPNITRVGAPLLRLVDMELSQRPPLHQLLAERAEAEAGNPERRVPVDRQAAAAVEGGAGDQSY